VSQLNQNRYDQILRRVGDIKGPGSKVNDALSELFPVIDVENVPGELLILGGTNLGMGASNLTGAVGEIPKIQVFNPAGSNAIVTVTRIDVTSNSTGLFNIGVAAIPLTDGIATQVFRDSRKGFINRPVAGMFQESSAPGVDANAIIGHLVNQDTVIQDDRGLFVLGPGTGVSVGHQVTNTKIRVTFWWRERPAETSELNF